MIPCLHQVWLGGQPYPPILGAFMDAAQAVVNRTYGKWFYTRWCDEDLELAFDEWSELASRCCHVSQQSDVARCLILGRFGGLYLDTDVELFALPENLVGTWIAGTSNDPAERTVNGCCLACEPGAAYVRRMLDKIRSGQVDLGKHMAAGPDLCMAELGPDVNIWPAQVWHGRRGDGVALGHHYGWGPKIGSFLRSGNMPPTSPLAT